jgi:hypothetical protein
MSVTYTWYLSSSAPEDANTAFMTASTTQGSGDTTADLGWICSGTFGDLVGTYSDIYADSIRPQGSFSGSYVPLPLSASINFGNGWVVAGPLTGSFAAGNWTKKQQLIESGNSSIDVRETFMMYKSYNVDGSSGSIISPLYSSSIGVNIGDNPNGKQVSTTFNPGQLNFNQEYLFILSGMKIEQIPAAGYVLLRIGSSSFITSTPFTWASQSFRTPIFIYGGTIFGGQLLTDTSLF